MGEDVRFRFLVDENLLGLVRRLRMMGLDTLAGSGPDSEVLAFAKQTGRLLLTKDRRFFIQHAEDPIYFIKGEDPKEQLLEVLRKFNLKNEIHPLSRCFRCNSLIHEIPKELLHERVDAKTSHLYEKFYECPTCRKIFWEGSHYDNMKKQIVRIQEELR